MFKALITARIRAEFAFYKMINNVMVFNDIWGIDKLFCVVDKEETFIIHIFFLFFFYLV